MLQPIGDRSCRRRIAAGLRWLARSVVLVTAALALSASHIGAASAQSYPIRPIKLIVPFIAGSPVDALARVVAQHLGTRLGQTILIENLSGAGGTIGTRAAAAASPDGYTLLFILNSHAYGLYANPGYDAIRSFAPVASVAAWSHVLIVRPDFPARTVGELIDHAKSHPGTVTFGFGINTPPQILGETLKIVSGADIRSIPYRGGAQAINDMLGGRIDINFGSTSTLLPLIQQGKLRALAYTGARRSPDLPDIPTIVEAGYPQLAFSPDAWAAILAPADTPAAIAETLNAAVNETLRAADLQAAFHKLGYEPRPMSRSELAEFLVSEMRRWPPIVQAAGLKTE